MPAVSVVVATRNPGSTLPGLVRSVDAQTLPAADFELVVVDASGDGSADRLQQLAGRRPNVRVLTADPKRAEADRLGLALQQAAGDHVLVIGQRQRLAPRALELLLERARRTGADVVLGRVVTGTDSGSAVLPDDADGIDSAVVDPKRCLALVRRTLVADRPDAGAALLDPSALTREAAAVSTLGRYACALSAEGRVPSLGGVSPEPPAYLWAQGALQVTVRTRLPQAPAAMPRAWLVLVQDLAEVAVPASVDPDGERTTLTVSAAVDPRTALAGRPLEDGPWDLLLRLAWPDEEMTLPLTVGPARSAVLDGRPYVVRVTGGALQLDAGATRSSAIGPVAASRAAVAESVRGALLILEYPSLHVQGDGDLEARVVLDGLGLPGRLVCRDGGARFEAFVSGLAGTVPLSVVAGGGRPVSTGLALRVTGAGGMTLQKAAPPKPSTPAAPGSVPLAQRLRRRLPGALEPAAHRLAQVPALRRVYRRLLNR